MAQIKCLKLNDASDGFVIRGELDDIQAASAVHLITADVNVTELSGF